MSRVTLERDELQKLADHAIHFGNCPYDSWNKKLTRCRCGLFQLLRSLEERKLIKTPAELREDRP